ncbi:hypothetical protein [Streptomyces exfoliatus]|uniref:hypothetical protein n=1 Tax=Streptomyces exfoliatus TaxID=1905 RepID=UPI003C2AD1EA
MAGKDRGSRVETHGTHSIAADTIGSGATFNLQQTPRRRLLEVLPLFVAVAVAGYAALAWPGGPQSQYHLFYGSLGAGFVSAVAYAVRGKGWLLLTLALGCSLLGLGLFGSTARNGEVPVEIDVRGAQPLRGSQAGHLTLVMPAPKSGDVRDRLRLALTISDDDPFTPTCIHKTTATLTATTPGVTPSSRRVAADSVVDLDLGGHRGEVTVAFALHTEPNCVMRLAKVKGTLHNR